LSFSSDEKPELKLSKICCSLRLPGDKKPNFGADMNQSRSLCCPINVGTKLSLNLKSQKSEELFRCLPKARYWREGKISEQTKEVNNKFKKIL
jgi:hypothetical protein